MKKAAEAFRSIGEVSQLVGVAPHVLRYWETQFPLFNPVKRRDGRRYYRPDDVRLAAGLCEILREEGVSIRGAKKQMAADRGAGLKARGAARLGGVFADENEGAPVAVTATTDSKATAEAAPEAGTSRAAPRRRKRDADASTLPLFPEMVPTPNHVPLAGIESPAGRVRAVRLPSKTDWLGRLNGLRDGLRGLADSAALRSQAASLHKRLATARNSRIA